MERDSHKHSSKCDHEEFLPGHCVDLAEGALYGFVLVRMESLVQSDCRERGRPDGGRWVNQESSG